MAATATIDMAEAEAFGAKVVGFLNGAGATLALAIGHRTGLFDSMSRRPAASSGELAAASNLDERYVREWLALMTVAGVIEYDAQARSYGLSAEHAASLTTAAGPGNLAVMADSLRMLAGVSEELEQVFRNGGGVPYESFPDFQRLMAENSALRFDANLISEQLPLVPGIESRLAEGADVADLGCGAGRAVNLMAEAWPTSRFVGYDLSADAIELARTEASDRGLTNARFEVADIPTLTGWGNEFDLVTTFDAVHDQADPAGFLEVAFALLRPGGSYLCVDIAASSELADNVGLPLAPMMYTASLFHCMTVSLARGGAGLGTMWGEQLALEMLHEAGFDDVEVAKVDGDIFNNYYVCTKPS